MKTRIHKSSRINSRGAYALAIALLVVAFPFFGLRRLEYAVTFHPERIAPGQRWIAPDRGEDVWFTARDNVRLHGWFINSEARPALATLIYFHGNGGNISHVGWLGESLSRRGFDVLLFDYRGYGRSEGSISDEEDLYADADAAYDYVINHRGASPERIALYGQSLGTAAVADLAARKPVGAIIIESGLSSADRMAEKMMPWLPRFLRGLGNNRFESARKLARVHCPTLITHGDPDPVIPVDQGRELFAAASEPKKLILVPGAGHCVFGFGGDQYLDQIAAFIRLRIVGRKEQSSLLQLHSQQRARDPRMPE